MADFTSILSKKATEVEKPKPKPAGTYLGQTVGMPSQKTATVQGEERLIMSFKLKAIAAMQDVDAALIGSEGIGEISSWPTFNHDFWVDSPEGEFRFKQFLTEVLKVDPGPTDNPKSLGEMAAESAGRQLTFTLIHKPYIDKNTNEPAIAANVGATAAA